MPIAQAAAMSVELRPDVDIKLILPPEPGTSKGTKGRPVRKHRHVTKVSEDDFAREYFTDLGNSLYITIKVSPHSKIDMLLTVYSPGVRDGHPIPASHYRCRSPSLLA